MCLLVNISKKVSVFMKSGSDWNSKCTNAIGSEINRFTQNGGDISRLTDADKARLKQAIDAAYPFGERRNHPYKVWLKARKQAFLRLGIEVKPKKQKVVGPEEQTSLF